MEEKISQIAVLGLGYVGSVTAACLARLGHRVVGVDRDPFKVDSIRGGRAPFFEPGLEEAIQEGVAAGRLTSSTSLADALADSDMALICVGTPSAKNGNLGLDQLQRVFEDLAALLPGRSKPLIVAVRSTVFPGTCEELAAASFGGRAGVAVVSNPEFLREGTAMRDFTEPAIVVVGGQDAAVVRRAAAIYDGLGVPPCLVSLRTAEMIKYSCNAFHALKIAFANEMGTLSAKMGIDPVEVMDTLCQDHKLNISPVYLRPGFAFGGSCLPKDLRALNYRALHMDLTLPLMNAILPSNERHLERAIQRILDLPVERIGIYGLAFKEDTDDLRESPIVSLIEQLIGKGRSVRIFDPHIQLDHIYGANKNFLLATIPHIGKLLGNGVEHLLGWSERLVLAQKPNAAAMDAIRSSGVTAVDLTAIQAGR